MHLTVMIHLKPKRMSAAFELSLLTLLFGLLCILSNVQAQENTPLNESSNFQNTEQTPFDFELKLDQNFPTNNLISPPFIEPTEQLLEQQRLLGIERLIDSPITQKIDIPATTSDSQGQLNTEPEEQNLFNLTLESMEQTTTSTEPPNQNKIVILKVVDYRDQQFLKIDSNSRIQFNDKIFEAINHEINLNFKIQMQLTEANRLLGIPYQRTRKAIDYHVKLLSDGLEQTFHLENTRNGHTQSFRDIDAALETLSTIKAFEIAELSELHPRQIYTLRMRISLDIWKLPTPLLLEALFTENWQLDSDWFETTLKAPQSWQ